MYNILRIGYYDSVPQLLMPRAEFCVLRDAGCALINVTAGLHTCVRACVRAHDISRICHPVVLSARLCVTGD